MKRRTFLKSLVAGGVLAGQGAPALAYARRKPTIVVITDIDPDTPVQRLGAMLGAMLAKGLPVSCIVHTRAPSGTVLLPDSELANLLRGFIARAPGLIEIVGYVGDLAQKSGHFQARLAYAARKELVEALIPQAGIAGAGPLLQSLACAHTAEPLSPEAVRSAGIRNVLVLPDTSAPVTTETWNNGVLRIFGGARANLFAAVENLGLLGPDQFQNVILLSVRENSAKSEHLIAAAATVFANVALQHEADQWISNLRLCDLQMRDGYFKFERRVGLHLFEPPADAVDLVPGFEAFKADLVARKTPFSTGPWSPANSAQFGQGYWITTEGPATDIIARASRETLVALDCAQSPRPLAPAAQPFLDAGLGLIFDARAGGIQGIDDCGRLHIPVIPVSKAQQQQTRLLAGAANSRDLVLAIAPDILATKALRNALGTELEALTSDWVTKIVPIAGLARPIAPTGQLISVYRQTEAYAPRIQPGPTDLDQTQQQVLLENAIQAWSYFYRFTNKSTGLCPSTVRFSLGDELQLKSATMWDIGSHINALMAAVDLEIISEAEFRRGISKILYNIKGRTSNGRNLPNEWIKTNQSRRGNTNFDGCDAGRLLASLWNLSQHRYGDDTPAKLVKSWDLDKIIVDRRIQSVKDAALVSTYESHCAHYAALAFRAWGFDVESPYEVFGDLPTCDARMALIDVVAGIGPLGAEPLMLEAVDFGLSPESAYLADVLFGAQLREYDTSGEVVCVSEGPIDRSPWFTYQGLQFDAPDRTWAIDTVRDDPLYTTPEFQREFRCVSPKAAFLWAAHAPHPFSNTLLDYVRTRGKTTIGFASSIYSRTGKPTQNYSDINTNGIILQAVAKILGKTSGGGLKLSHANLK